MTKYDIIKSLELKEKKSKKKKIAILYILISEIQHIKKINNKKDTFKKLTIINIYKIIKLLIHMKADINYVSKNETFNLLMIAIISRDTKIIKMLIDNNININYNLSNIETSNALITSIVFDNKDAFNLIIKNPKLDINQTNYLGKTALFYACDESKLYYANKLIEYGINVNQLDNNKIAVIRYVILAKNIRLLNKLMILTASVYLKNPVNNVMNELKKLYDELRQIN